MKKIICFLVLLISFGTSSAQIFNLSNLDLSRFPIIKSDILLKIDSINFFTNLNKDDFTIVENGIEKKITNIECHSNSIEENLSSLLLVDASESMQGKNLETAKNCSRYWINTVKFPLSECALVSFDDFPNILSDFTTNKNNLLKKIEYLNSNGSTNYDEAFLEKFAGAINLCKKGKNKKIIIFLTDGQPNFNPKIQEIIDSANINNISIFSLTIGGPAHESMKLFSKQTGGEYFENIKSIDDGIKYFSLIEANAKKISLCSIEWKSELICDKSNINILATYKPLKLQTQLNILLDSGKIKTLSINPKIITFTNPTLNENNDSYVTIKAMNGSFNITDIFSSNSNIEISPKIFTLNDGDSIKLLIRTKPNQALYKCDTIKIITNECEKQILLIQGFSYNYNFESPLKLLIPNGKEVFLKGSDTVVTWTGIDPNENIKIEFSADSGRSWNVIAEKSNNYKFNWRNLPGPASDKCLIRISTYIDSTDLFKSPYLIYKLSDLYFPSFSTGEWNFNDSIIVYWKNRLTLIDERNGNKISEQRFLSNNNAKLRWNPNNLFVSDGSNIWDTKKTTNDNFYKIPYPVTSFAWNSTGEYYAIGTVEGVIYIFKTVDNSPVFSRLCNNSAIKHLEWKKELIVALDELGYLYTVSDFNKYTEENTSLNEKILDFSVSNNCKFIALSSKSKLKIREIVSGKEIVSFSLNNFDHYGQLVWDPVDKYIACVMNTDSLVIFDWNYGKAIKEFKFGNGLNDVKWDNRGQRIAIAAGWKGIKIYDLPKDKYVFEINENRNFTSVSWNIKSTKICVTSRDNDNDLRVYYIGNTYLTPKTDISDTTFTICYAELSSEAIDMGECLIGSHKDSVITKFTFNPGKYKNRIDSIYIQGSDSDAFKLIGGLPVYELAPGESKYAEFDFKPKRLGIHQANIVIKSQADAVLVPIKGFGVEPKLQLINKDLDFGTIALGDEKIIYDTTLIQNIGSSSITISKTSILEPNLNQFEVLSGANGFMLAPGEIKKLTIKYKPKYAGRSTARLGFEYEGVGSPSIVNLYGTATGCIVAVKNDSAYAGEKRNIKIVLKNVLPNGLKKLANKYKAVLKISSNIFTPIDRTIVKNFNIDSTTVEFVGTIPENDILATIPAIACLGSEEFANMYIEEIRLYDEIGNEIDYDFEFEPGLFKLLGICNEGGKRLVNGFANAALKSFSPNPIKNEIKITLEISEFGHNDIFIVNELGDVVKTININDVSYNSTVSKDIDVHDLPSGNYKLIFKTPTIFEYRNIIIIK